MQSYAQRRICRIVPAMIGLFATAVLTALPFLAHAADGVPPQFTPPFAFKQYHLQYDVNADGTYTEQGDVALTVLNAQGVEMSRHMPVGVQNDAMPGVSLDAEILAVYTLKKAGEHIDATPTSPPAGMPPGAAMAQTKMKFFSFQKVEVGDTLVMSYKAVQKKPPIPNAVVLDERFPKFVEYDDAEMSLKAPVSLHLRVETFGVEKAQSSIEGQTQTWQWKYQNKTPVAPQPGPPPFDRIHISSFKDGAAEQDALGRLTSTLAVLLPVPDQPCADAHNAAVVYAHVVEQLFWTNGSELERLVNAWNDPSCVFRDGKPMLNALRDGYSQAISNANDWSKVQARIESLKKQFPNKAFVALAEASYWKSYAWDARGGGYASSVADDGWKLFHERLEQAEKVLLDSKRYAAQMPVWYADMISVHGSLGRAEDERDQLFLEGVKRYPAYYPIYFTMQNFLLPKWGGTWRTVDNMVKWSVEHTKAREGMTMYARIYWSVAKDPSVDLFKDTFATWPKMKKGFEDLMARHPKSTWNLNNFARFACLAEDKNTFLALRRKMGKDVENEAWMGSTTLDLCETKFGYAE